ncbi:MAG: IS481 family transposase, partial [Terriglobales bacterium]
MSTDEKIIKNKVGLLKLSEELYEKGGELALREISRRKPCPRNRVEEHVEKAVLEIA